MKIRIFQSDHGDCLLLQNEGHNILCDGGLYSSMKSHVRKPLKKLVEDNGGLLDAIYVSHLDQDHISGILQLMRDAVDWKVFDYHRNNGDMDVIEPGFIRPPKIGMLWHNSFRDQVGKNVGEIGDILAAAAPVLISTGVKEFIEEAHEIGNVASSIREALEVSSYTKPEFLDIKTNILPGHNGPGKLLFRKGNGTKFSIGSMNFTIVGPSKEALNDLRDGWNNWLEKSEGIRGTKAIKKKVKKQLERFASGQTNQSPFDLYNWNGISSFRGVTAPNVASLVLMVEENGKLILLTGDAQQDKLLEDLEATGYLSEGYCHLDVLKVAHHGSEHNTDENFVKLISAENYVFCGNGANGNPEPKVLEYIYNSRLGSNRKRALSPQAKDRPFTFWFSTNSEALPHDSEERKNFEETEKIVKDMAKNSNGLMKANFVRREYRTIDI
ncbi:hypothetical protein [Marinicella meishanensis]|uniref:hypothetical protein n=1 Tax=Marinicella meishanensis TaxID=2873263 RepID=UPI001CBB50C0|nr:hypothetical protein [Marinicella sp. NBU2979]